jgi:hypothetical protein
VNGSPGIAGADEIDTTMATAGALVSALAFGNWGGVGGEWMDSFF